MRPSAKCGYSTTTSAIQERVNHFEAKRANKSVLIGRDEIYRANTVMLKSANYDMSISLYQRFIKCDKCLY